MNLEQRLIRVESIEAIRTLKARYCDLCDEGYDADALCALFTEDAVWDGGKLGVYEGIDKIHEFFVDMPNVMSFAIHNVTNSAVELSQDGQSAVARWYLIQMATQKEKNLAVWLTGRYVDQLVLENDIWKFKHVSLTARFYSPYDQGWAERNFVAAKS
tara:strand:+ start:106 stop:579 length:474 start_codon:yes stop_codon:yes gene_type:complete